jgi:hypothetical protein
MKSIIQNRAVRCITSALLGSTLSERELDEVANELLHGGNLTRQIGKIIREFLADAGSSSGIAKVSQLEEDIKLTGHPLADEAMAIIKKKRLSKVSIIKKMGVISPKAFDYFRERMDVSVQEMLLEFFKNEPHDKGFAFLELLEGRTSRDDEYLRGIMREKK